MFLPTVKLHTAGSQLIHSATPFQLQDFKLEAFASQTV